MNRHNTRQSSAGTCTDIVVAAAPRVVQVEQTERVAAVAVVVSEQAVAG